MALIDYTVRLTNRFNCAQPQDASPQLKRGNLLPHVYNVRLPHCLVEIEVGTRGVYCERTNANHYQAHVPDSPVMLGAEQLASYTRAAQETKFFGWRRACAIGACVTVGLLGGALGTGLIWLASVVLHGLAPASVPVLTAMGAKICYVFLGCLALSMLSGEENVAWHHAHERFETLEALARAYERGAHVGADERHKPAARVLLEQSLASTDFAVQQAAFELLAAGHLGQVPEQAPRKAG